MKYDKKLIQVSLNSKGFYGFGGQPLIVDGVIGANTRFAIINFKKSVGLSATDVVGPVTYARLTGDSKPLQDKLPAKADYPLWYNEAISMLGTHEDRDHAELAAWLKSDGYTVGDPALVPYCGDGVQTSFLRAYPDMEMPENPYLAANWAGWGHEVEPQLGSVLSFWRGSPNSWQGHVGFYAGESKTNFYVLGFNQNDAVTISPIAKNRLRKDGSRWPDDSRVPLPTGKKVIMSGGVRTTNET